VQQRAQRHPALVQLLHPLVQLLSLRVSAIKQNLTHKIAALKNMKNLQLTQEIQNYFGLLVKPNFKFCASGLKKH
jgi:hypothetical protein